MIREIISNEWFVILIIINLIILAFTKFSFTKRFHDYLWVLGNSKYLKVYAREQKFIDQFEGLLFLNLSISLSIFIFICYGVFVEIQVFALDTFIKIWLCLNVLLIIKTSVERLVGRVFDIEILINSYIFQKTVFRNYVGLFLIPLNIILLFAFEPSPFLLYIVFVLASLILFTGFITSFKAHQKTIINNLFYFILYLCALEIAPYVILYGIFITNSN